MFLMWDRIFSLKVIQVRIFLNTIVRIKSILHKYQAQGHSLDGLKYIGTCGLEKALMLEAAKYTFDRKCVPDLHR